MMILTNLLVGLAVIQEVGTTLTVELEVLDLWVGQGANLGVDLGHIVILEVILDLEVDLALAADQDHAASRVVVQEVIQAAESQGVDPEVDQRVNQVVDQDLWVNQEEDQGVVQEVSQGVVQVVDQGQGVVQAVDQGQGVVQVVDQGQGVVW